MNRLLFLLSILVCVAAPLALLKVVLANQVSLELAFFLIVAFTIAALYVIVKWE